MKKKTKELNTIKLIEEIMERHRIKKNIFLTCIKMTKYSDETYEKN